MDGRLVPKYSWSDEQLTDAVRTAWHWRGVMRALGIPTNSEGVLRRIRRDVSRLKLDVSHFRGSRTWSDAALIGAIAEARTWDEALTSLGISDPGKETRLRIKGHAMRLGLDTSHLESREPNRHEAMTLRPDVRHLREAGPSMAAAWFTLCGCIPAFPVEPFVFDLLVRMPGGVHHVQVKTTTCRNGDSWQVRVGRRPHSIGNRAPLTPYDPDVIDLFFIVDGELNMYLIPSRVIAGRVAILLRTYTAYIVGNAGGLLAAAAAPEAASP